MKTISAKVTDEFYILAKRVAEENNISVSSMIKQAFETSKIQDKSIELKMLNQLHSIREEVSRISEHCDINKVIDKQILFTLSSMEESLKYIRESLEI